MFMCKIASKPIVLRTLIFLGVAVLAISGPTKADNIGITRDCTQSIAGHKIEAIATPLGDGNFTARLIVDGGSLPLLGKSCFVSTRLGTRYVLCSFQIDARSRFEFYPVTETTSGLLTFMQYVIWHGNKAISGSFTNCVE